METLCAAEPPPRANEPTSSRGWPDPWHVFAGAGGRELKFECTEPRLIAMVSAGSARSPGFTPPFARIHTRWGRSARPCRALHASEQPHGSVSHGATRRLQREISIQPEGPPTSCTRRCSSALTSERLRLVRPGSRGSKRVITISAPTEEERRRTLLSAVRERFSRRAADQRSNRARTSLRGRSRARGRKPGT